MLDPSNNSLPPPPNSPPRPAAADGLMPLVYDELRNLASRAMRREAASHTLQTTAVVHEAYLRLRQQRQLAGMSREQFLSLAATMIRRILVDHARARQAAKRGADAERITLSGVDLASSGDDPADRIDGPDVLKLDDALARLGTLNGRTARVVELRYFGGMTVAETAAAMGVSERLVNSEWTFARAWLRRELADVGDAGPNPPCPLIVAPHPEPRTLVHAEKPAAQPLSSGLSVIPPPLAHP